MNQPNRHQSAGYNLIQLIIVLAIVGLLMVLVFLAVISAQKSAKDNTTRTAANDVITAMKQYYLEGGGNAYIGCANNLTTIPGFQTPKDAYGNTPVFYCPVSLAQPPGSRGTPQTIVFSAGAVCQADGSYVASTDSTIVAVSYWSAITNGPVCIGSQ